MTMTDTTTFRPQMRHSESTQSVPSNLDGAQSGSNASGSRPLRLGTLQGFLPLNDQRRSSAIGTRGQHLPQLLSASFTRTSSGIWFHEHESDRHGLKTEDSVEHGDVLRSRRGSESSTDMRNPDDDAHGLIMRHGNRRGSLPLRDREASEVLNSEQMRSQRLIGNSNRRYRWAQYWKTEEELKKMTKPLRKYYERNNSLIQQYTFIDRLLDSSLPHDLIQEYRHTATPTTPGISSMPPDIPETICEECGDVRIPGTQHNPTAADARDSPNGTVRHPHTKVKRTPKNLYKIPGPPSPSTPSESTPLLKPNPEDPEEPISSMPEWTPEEEADSSSRIVNIAIYANLAANVVLLILKIIVAVLTESVSVLAALVDAVLDFLSTTIVGVTTYIINRNSASDKEKYPVGRRRLEPIAVLVFSVVMITAFFQVALEGLKRLTGSDHIVVQLSPPAIAIMASTVGIKGLCWLWCKAIRNSSVQALAQDAITDVVFNTFSIIFPLVGFYARIWWLDPLGGVLLSAYVILNWSGTASFHIGRLSGAAASADERNVLLYLTMRFAKTIKQIQGVTAYHAGDKLNVEVDVVLDEQTSLRDSHDLGESLQYVLESVPTVDRAFVHLDYAGWNVSLCLYFHLVLKCLQETLTELAVAESYAAAGRLDGWSLYEKFDSMQCKPHSFM